MGDAPTEVELFLRDDLPQQLLLTPLPDDVSAAVVDRLKQEADRHWGIDPHRSLEFADRIVAIGGARADSRQVALGLMARGDALKLLGETLQAWEALEQAGEMFQNAGDEVGWARTRIGRLYLSTMLNCVPQALAEAELAREILERKHERDKLLRLIYMIAYVHNYLFEQRQALELYKSCLAIAEELGEAGEAYLGIIYASMGTGYITLGDNRQAQEYYQRAHNQYTARGETLNLAGVDADLGYLAQMQGHFRHGLQLLTSSLEYSQAFSHLEAAKIRWNMLDCYLGLNRYAEARDLARQLVEDFRVLKDAFELARSLLQLGTIEAELTDYTAAQAALNEAEAIYISLNASAWKAIVWLRRGRVALRQGDFATACQIAQDAAKIFESSDQRVNHATARLLHGEALMALEDLPATIASGRFALEIAQRDNVPSLRYAAHLLLGQVSEKQSAIERAMHHYRAAAATTERVQRGLTITMRPGFLEDKAQAWRALISIYMRQDRLGNAFEVLERAKSQVLLGHLANQESLHWAGGDARSLSLIQELEQLRAEHQWFYRQVHDLPQETSQSHLHEKQRALDEIRARERRMRLITEQLYLHNEASGAANPVVAPSQAEVRSALGEDELLLEFYNDGARLYAFSLSTHSIQVHCLPVELDVLGHLLAQLRLNLSTALQIGPQAPANDSLLHNVQRILSRLYALLLGPLALESGSWRRLIIVPYGELHFLPFHLLHDGHVYLFERFEVVVMPAAGLVTYPAPRRKPGALVLAHSWDGRLPYTLIEADVVQRLFGGKLFAEAAADRLAFQEPPLQILHIAAHGQHRLDQPDLSYIQLADGQFYADDLFQHDLSYELVTLSACETGRANISPGDELIGLGRGFLYSGAGALIVSLWQVADATTTRLMELIYRGLHEGLSKAAALRSAQQVILAESPQLHPAYWGGFQLIGNSHPLTTWAETI